MPRGNKYWNLALLVGGSLKNRDNKICSWVLWDADPRKIPLARPGNNWKVRTRLLVREGAPHQQTRNCLKIIKEIRPEICRGSQMGAWHQDRRGRLTVGRNVTLTIDYKVWGALVQAVRSVKRPNRRTHRILVRSDTYNYNSAFLSNKTRVEHVCAVSERALKVRDWLRSYRLHLNEICLLRLHHSMCIRIALPGTPSTSHGLPTACCLLGVRCIPEGVLNRRIRHFCSRNPDVEHPVA
jgi:hypothetical protein